MSEKCYTRIKRGMVFWYNIDASVNKFNVPDIKVSDNKSFKDYLMYGERPWLLMSVDEKNIQNRTCTIIPLCTNEVVERDNDKFHIQIQFKGKNASIMCEQLRTVNCSELIKYDCILEPNVMERVEETVREYLGIGSNSPFKGLVSDDVVGKLEEVIDSIVKKKVEEERRKDMQFINVDDAVLRISEGLETLFDVKSSEKEIKVEKKVEEIPVVREDEYMVRVPEVRKKDKSSRKRKNAENRSRMTKTTKERWDKPSAISFIQSVHIEGADTIANKFGYANGKSVMKTVKYLEDKYSL